MTAVGTSEKNKKTLAAYLSSGRLPHALLVEGGSPQDRQRFATTIAQGALCEAPPDRRPCGECRHCVKVDKEIHPDLLTFTGEGGARSFHIDTVRQLRQEAYVRPNEADHKVLLLADVQTMSVQAQNALLKIIEEPPRGVHFILTCDNKAALLETILSRTTAFTLDTAPQSAGGEDTEQAAGILYNACIGSELDALAALSPFERDRQGLAALLGQMRVLLGKLMLHPDQIQQPQLLELAKRAGPLQLMRILVIIEDAHTAAQRNASGLLLTSALCAGIRSVLAGT